MDWPATEFANVSESSLGGAEKLPPPFLDWELFTERKKKKLTSVFRVLKRGRQKNVPRHPCAFGPRSIGARVRLPVSFFAGTEEDATKKETQRIRRRHETAFFSFPIFFSASSSLGAGIDRNSSEIRHTNDRGCLSKRRIPKHPPPANTHDDAKLLSFEKRRTKDEKTTREENDDAPSGDVSLRRGHADGLGGSSLGQGEHDRFG